MLSIAFYIVIAMSIVMITIDRLLKSWQRREQEKLDELSRAYLS
jgi:hypothetical protein